MAKHWWPLPLLVLVITAAAVGITYYTGTGVFSESSGDSSDGRKNSNNGPPESIDKDQDALLQDNCELRNTYWDDSKKSCEQCPATKKYFAVFWESHVNGCLEFKNNEEAFKHITHIYWGFAEVSETTGEVEQTFQGNDATLINCMASMRSKCVKQLASIGGATNRARFLSLDSEAKWTKFGQSAAQLVKKFNFDGIDIDDESGNGLTPNQDWYASSNNVVGYLTATRAALQSLPRNASEPAYELTWDEFPTSIDPTKCNDKTSEWKRCYNKNISDIVDWVNLMMYNDDLSSSYDEYLNEIVPNLWTKEIPKEKIVLGGCVGDPQDKNQGTCSYGAAPSEAQLVRYAKDGASNYGGTMLWTASADYSSYDTKNIKSMGVAGNYGVFAGN